MIVEDDDLSALTGAPETHDWDDEAQAGTETGESKGDGRAGVAGGDMEDKDRLPVVDEEDSDEEELHRMVVDGFECPEALLSKLLPMEFEEMVNLFKTYDANGSGTIDKHEARKILQSLGMETSLEKSEELLKLVDADGSGEIDFDEYCFFIQMIKDGDERFSQYNTILNMVSNTPLGDLEHQASQRHFKLKFETLAVRPATATLPQTFVVELLMAGTWFERKDGVITSEHCTKKFQGLGTTNKEAKYAAAKVKNVLPSSFSDCAQKKISRPSSQHPVHNSPPRFLRWPPPSCTP